MGSLAFDGVDESLPSTSNVAKSCRLSTALLHGCDASIPKKLRSVLKKRGRESITSPLLISRNQNHVLASVDTLKKDCAKKTKLNMKRGHISNDEKEVAETLYALAGMFSDANKDDQLPLEEGSSINAAQDADTCTIYQQETRKMSSDLVNSTAEEAISQTSEAPQPEFFSSNKASGDQSDLTPASTSRPLVSILGSNDSDLFQSATGASSSETHKSGPRIPSLVDSKKKSSQPCFIENKTTTEKHTRVAIKSKKSWKRCSAHVYISRLINVLQISDGKEGLPVQPTQSTCGGAELQPHVSLHNQMPISNDRNRDAYFSAIDHFAANKGSSEIQNDLLLHKKPIEYQQMASETSALCSAKQGYDFLSLGTGLCGLDTSKSANREGCFHEPPQQLYMQSQNHSSLLCSLPQNGRSSSFHGHNSTLTAQQVQLAQYNNYFTARRGQQTEMEMQQQKWGAQFQTHYNTGGGSVPRFPDSASVLNYAHSLFPHLHAALGSKYQQLSPSKQQVMAMKKHHHNLPLGFERNGAMYHPENMLQLPCNQQL